LHIDTKGHKDQFMKKIEKVSKTYDYKDETKDQKAKVSSILAKRPSKAQ